MNPDATHTGAEATEYDRRRYSLLLPLLVFVLATATSWWQPLWQDAYASEPSLG